MITTIQLVAVSVLGVFLVVGVALVSRQRRRHRASREAEASFAAAIRGFSARPAVALGGLADASEKLPPARVDSLIGETHLYEVITSHLEALSSEEAGRSALEDFFTRLGQRLVDHDAQTTIEVVQQLFASHPHDGEALRCGLTLLRALPPMSLGLSEGLYRSSLEILEQHPRSQALESLVLEVGRWHLDRVHDAGGSSYYDERAIQNDILARTA